MRGDVKESFAVKFWLTSGIVDSSQIESNWNFMLPPGSKPFIVYDWGFDATNSFLGYERIFTDFLLANPKAIGQIRVFANTHKSFQEEKAGLMSKLSSVPTKQLKFLWNRNDSGGAGEWKIIPPKK